MIGLFRKDIYRDFWKWFSQYSRAFFNEFDDKTDFIMGQIINRLKEIDKNLTCEISVIKGNQHREIVLSADGIAESFNSVKTLYEQAPQISNWEVICFLNNIRNYNRIIFC
jgi:hypothetical protein